MYPVRSAVARTLPATTTGCTVSQAPPQAVSVASAGCVEAFMERSGRGWRHEEWPLQPALTAKPLPSPQAESPPRPSCLRKESTGLCCILLCLGWAFCGLCLGSREPARRPLTLTASPLVGHGGQRETWLCTALCTSSSHFLPSSRFCAQGIFGCLSGLLLTILFL